MFVCFTLPRHFLSFTVMSQRSHIHFTFFLTPDVFQVCIYFCLAHAMRRAMKFQIAYPNCWFHRCASTGTEVSIYLWDWSAAPYMLFALVKHCKYYVIDRHLMRAKTVVTKGTISTDTFGSFKSRQGLKDQSLACVFLLCILPTAETLQALLFLAADVNVCA